jgi:hypothetical protein
VNPEQDDPEGFRFDSDPDDELIDQVLTFNLQDFHSFGEWQAKLNSLARRDSVAAVERALGKLRIPRTDGEGNVPLLVLQRLVPPGHWAKDAALRYCTEWLQADPEALDGSLPMLMGTMGLAAPREWLLERLDHADPGLRQEALSAVWQEMMARATGGPHFFDGTYEFQNDPRLEVLLAAARDSDYSVRLAAISMLESCLSPRRAAQSIRETFVDLMADPDVAIRALAVSGLCSIHEPGIERVLRGMLEAVLDSPDRVVEGRACGPGHLMMLADGVDRLGDLSLMPLMEAIDERWNIADQDYLDAYGLRWRSTPDVIDRMRSGLESPVSHIHWDALNHLSVFDPEAARARLPQDLTNSSLPADFEDCAHTVCETVSRLRSPALLPALRQLQSRLTGPPRMAEKYVKDVEHLIVLCESSA